MPFIAWFEYPPKWYTGSAIWLLPGWCHVKLLSSWCTFRVHHITMHQFTVSPHSKPHMQGAGVFSSILPPALLAEWPESFTYYCCKVKLWWKRCGNESLHRKLILEKKILLLFILLNLRPLNHESPPLYHWAIPTVHIYLLQCFPRNLSVLHYISLQLHFILPACIVVFCYLSIVDLCSRSLLWLASLTHVFSRFLLPKCIPHHSDFFSYHITWTFFFIWIPPHPHYPSQARLL